MKKDFVRLLAAWALLHETADESWKASVQRGNDIKPAGMEGSPDAFVDGLAAMIAEEKEQLKREIISGGIGPEGVASGESGDLEELKFEIGQVRTRLEAMETTLDSILVRLGNFDRRGGNNNNPAQEL